MSQLIKCPKCGKRDWSNDYWTCPSCSYEVLREQDLKEENKDFYEQSAKRGEVRTESVDFCLESQKKLTRKMVGDELLSYHNVRVDFPASDISPEGESCWGWARYRENDKIQAQINRFEYQTGIRLQYVKGVHSYSKKPSRISIPIPTLKELDGPSTHGYIAGKTWGGGFATVPHESAHVSHEVKRNPLVLDSHGDIWREVYKSFYDNVVSKGYREKWKRNVETMKKLIKWDK